MCVLQNVFYIFIEINMYQKKKERKKVGRWISVQRKVLIKTEGQKETEWDRTLSFHFNSGIWKLGHQSGKENTIPTGGFFDTVQLAMTQSVSKQITSFPFCPAVFLEC